MNRQLESMTRADVGVFKVRVWRTETDLSKVDNGDIHNLAFDIWINMKYVPMNLGILAEEFEKLPRISAVEVLDQHGNGVIIYPDWK